VALVTEAVSAHLPPAAAARRGGNPVTTDDVLPLLLYLVAVTPAAHTRLHTSRVYMREFQPPDLTSTELGCAPARACRSGWMATLTGGAARSFALSTFEAVVELLTTKGLRSSLIGMTLSDPRGYDRLHADKNACVSVVGAVASAPAAAATTTNAHAVPASERWGSAVPPAAARSGMPLSTLPTAAAGGAARPPDVLSLHPQGARPRPPAGPRPPDLISLSETAAAESTTDILSRLRADRDPTYF
jgi:hypothetical protein